MANEKANLEQFFEMMKIHLNMMKHATIHTQECEQLLIKYIKLRYDIQAKRDIEQKPLETDMELIKKTIENLEEKIGHLHNDMQRDFNMVYGIQVEIDKVIEKIN